MGIIPIPRETHIQMLASQVMEKNMTTLHSARILRVGSVLVDFDYGDVCDSINAEMFTAPQNERCQSVDFQLKPIGGNQISDESNIHDMHLISITISDNEFAKKYNQVFSTSPEEIRILSKNIKLAKQCSNVEVSENEIIFYIK